MPNKTDRNDARALAQIMRTGWFRQVHVKSRQCRLWRSLLVARRTVLNEMRGGDALVMPIVEPLLTILATMLRELARLTKQVFDIVRVEKVCRRLLGDGARLSGDDRPAGSVPTLTASRCASWPHAGALQSGETDIQGKISRCGDELARTALYEAAHTLLVRSRKWSSLRAWGMKIAKQRGMARARVAVARKLAVVLHRMWSDDSEFCFGKGARHACSSRRGLRR